MANKFFSGKQAPPFGSKKTAAEQKLEAKRGSGPKTKAELAMEKKRGVKKGD